MFSRRNSPIAALGRIVDFDGLVVAAALDVLREEQVGVQRNRRHNSNKASLNFIPRSFGNCISSHDYFQFTLLSFPVLSTISIYFPSVS
jgi:hypothetical protein